MESDDLKDWLKSGFETNRRRLRLLALRMLGTVTAADDALQEAWLRIARSGTGNIDNLEGWLTTLTSRVCIDMLRNRKARRETLVGLEVEAPARGPSVVDPEQEAILAEEIGSALLIVLGALSPAERVSYILHDLFTVDYDEVAAIVGRSETAVRQLASRARRRVRESPPVPVADARREREVVQAFLAASRQGNFEALLEIMSPDVVFRADEAGVKLGARATMRGNAVIAERIVSGPLDTLLALVNGKPGLVAITDGKPWLVLTFTIENEKIAGISFAGDPKIIQGLELVLLADGK